MHGHAAADITHLLAELVENAVNFSPEPAQVDIDAKSTPSGVTVEVVDRGIGMDTAQYTQLNATLAQLPEFDVMALSAEPHLGLFVVARLAARHGITVTLQPSPYGGVLARVALPASLLDKPHDSSSTKEDARETPVVEGENKGSAAQEDPAVQPGVTS